MEEKTLFSSNDEFLITQVCTILKENNIPYIRQDDGAGSYINVTYGQNTILDKKIIVNNEDFERAKELIDFLNKENESHEIPEELNEAEKEEMSYKNKYSIPRKIFGIMVWIFFGAIILIWIIQLIMYLA